MARGRCSAHFLAVVIRQFCFDIVSLLSAKWKSFQAMLLCILDLISQWWPWPCICTFCILPWFMATITHRSWDPHHSTIRSQVSCVTNKSTWNKVLKLCTLLIFVLLFVSCSRSPLWGQSETEGNFLVCLSSWCCSWWLKGLGDTKGGTKQHWSYINWSGVAIDIWICTSYLDHGAWRLQKYSCDKYAILTGFLWVHLLFSYSAETTWHSFWWWCSDVLPGFSQCCVEMHVKRCCWLSY